MSTLAGFFKSITGRQLMRKAHGAFSCFSSNVRTFADTPKTDANSNQVMAQGGALRVRRARAGDAARVLRFVRERARAAWPALAAPPSASHLLLCDYVARALAQGHSMLAEQQASRGLSQIRGLALGMSVCPWDATMLEKWARCVRCTRSRRLMHFTAHCLRAPALHDKYGVHNILQVILIVPPETPKSAEIVQVLAKNVIQRGRDAGFPILRFDVTDDSVSKSLEELELKKEWQLSYDVLPDTLKNDTIKNKPQNVISKDKTDAKVETSQASTALGGNFIAVYTAFTQAEKSS